MLKSILFLFLTIQFTSCLSRKRKLPLGPHSIEVDPPDEKYLYVEDGDNKPITVIREVHVLSELPADQVEKMRHSPEHFVLYNPAQIFRSISKHSVCKDCVDQDQNVYNLNLENDNNSDKGENGVDTARPKHTVIIKGPGYTGV